MPKIAQYNPDQVQTEVVQQPTAGSAPAATFGADIGKGLADVAQATFNMKKRIDTTSAEEASVQFERDKNELFFNPDTGYFNAQGKDAYDRSIETTKALEDLKRKYGETLNSEARTLFNGVADNQITRANVDIARNASKGLKAWEISTIEAQVENTIENAALYWGDSGRLKVQRVLGEQAVIDSSNMAGLSPEATNEKLQTFRSAFMTNTITAATQSSATEGKAALEQYGSQLEGPDKLKMDKLIEAKTKVEKTKSDAQFAVLTSESLVDKYDDLKDINKQIDKITDPERRKKTRSEASALHSNKRRADNQFQADSFIDADTFIGKSGSLEQWKSENGEAWESFTRKQQTKLENGGTVNNDWVKLNDLLLLPPNKLAKVNPNDYIHKFNDAGRKMLLAGIKNARNGKTPKIDSQPGRTRITQTNAAAEDLLNRKKSKWSNTDKDKVNSFYDLLDGEEARRKEELGRELKSSEYTDMLGDITAQVVKVNMFIDDELDIFETSEKYNIPVDIMPRLMAVLRTNNKAVTVKNLSSLYNQVKK